MVLINPGANALPNQRRSLARWNGCYILCGMDKQDQPAPPHLILIRIGRLPSWGAVSNSSSPAEKRLDPPRGQFILLSSVTTACVCGASEGPSGGNTAPSWGRTRIVWGQMHRHCWPKSDRRASLTDNPGQHPPLSGQRQTEISDY